MELQECVEKEMAFIEHYMRLYGVEYPVDQMLSEPGFKKFLRGCFEMCYTRGRIAALEQGNNALESLVAKNEKAIK